MLALGLLTAFFGSAAAGHAGAPAINFNVQLFGPPDAVKASLPVVFFVSGFGGNAPISAYSVLLTEIAAKGFLVVGLDHLSLPIPNYHDLAHDYLAVLQWAKEGSLRTMAAQRSIAAVPDLDRVAAMGHSAGSHVVGQALAYDCSFVKALVMLDPVDGADPFRIIKSEDLITPGKKLNFTVPSLILDNGLDTKPWSKFPPTPACAPSELSTARWFPAMRGPVWNVNATRYGHIDCLNDQDGRRWLCPTDDSSDKAAYKSFIATTTALFLNALFQGQQSSLALLADPQHFPLDVTVKQDLKGMALGDINPGCVNVRSGEPSLYV